MDYRVEKKYLVCEDEIAYIKTRLYSIMKIDEHSNNDTYLVRSVYFDDMNNSAYLQNEAGEDNRVKFRIRTYDNDLSHIALEEKSKKNGYTHKESVLLDYETAKRLLMPSGSFDAVRFLNTPMSADPFLLKKLYVNIGTRLLHPAVIVEYQRCAFVEKIGNVRITFDTAISSSRETQFFFKDSIAPIPVMKTGQHIMEIKYDEFLPEYIKKAIDIGCLQRTAFSKYYYAMNASSSLFYNTQ